MAEYSEEVYSGLYVGHPTVLTVQNGHVHCITVSIM